MQYHQGQVQGQGQIQIEFFHELDSKYKSQVQSLIPSHEQIFYSGTIEKINKNLVHQKRILIITNKSLYNIRPEGEGLLATLFPPLAGGASIQRKIDVSKIFAVTLSLRPQNNKNQFILHVAGEYDYRYVGGANTERIIKSILNMYCAIHKAPFMMYFIEETDLGRYHTTEDDLKADKNKRPWDGKVLVTSDMMVNGLSWVIANRFSLIQTQEVQRPMIQSQKPNPVWKVKSMYSSVPITPSFSAVTIEQRPVVTKVIYTPAVNVTVATTKIVTLAPNQVHVGTSNPVPIIGNNQTNFPNQNIQKYHGQFIPQPDYNQYGNATQVNQTTNLNDLVGVSSQQNVTINSNFGNK